jgi:hypothetical protein
MERLKKAKPTSVSWYLRPLPMRTLYRVRGGELDAECRRVLVNEELESLRQGRWRGVCKQRILSARSVAATRIPGNACGVLG